jgi:3D (Asp-Asp-Asp) domain-containing protein
MLSAVTTMMLTCAMVAISTAKTEPDALHIEATAYCDYGYTKSGCMVREGICAMNNEYLGKTAIVYSEEMEFIGIYEVLDTGSDYRLKGGQCIDIYMPDYDECIKFGRKKVIVFLLDAEG